MEDSRNAADIDLLKSDPRKLIVSYQGTIRIIVSTYIRSGMFDAADFNDIIQHLNNELLEKVPRIQQQYNGTSLFRTYLSNIIRHACLNLHQKKQRKPVFVGFADSFLTPGSNEIDRRHLIEHDVLTLRAIIQQSHSERPKLVLCLKLMYRIPITRKDILDWWPACSEHDLSTFLKAMDGEARRLTDKRAFELARPLMNSAESNTSSADAFRRWTDERILGILELLNGSPPTSAHNKETLGILLDDFFDPFLLK
jgi:hypothetical protein